MPRSMVGLLAAVSITMTGFTGVARGALIWMFIAASAAAGLAAYWVLLKNNNSARSSNSSSSTPRTNALLIDGQKIGGHCAI